MLREWRRRTYEFVGNDRLSRPALHELDRKLEHWLPHRHGTFVEAGANDGYDQSNTYYFERMRGWRGLLVEPVPWLAAECQRRRRRSVVIQAALVPFDYQSATIELDYSNLTSSIEGAFSSESVRQRHQLEGLCVQPGVVPARLSVPARTLQSVCEQAGVDREVDLFSLDVEGAEHLALSGVDLQRFRPRFMLIEVREVEKIEHLIGRYYKAEAELSKTSSYRDILYVRRY